MGNLGCGCGFLAALFALVGFVPFLGWANWLTTLPLSILAILFSWIALSRNESRTAATLGLIAGVILFFWSLFRLTIGGGIL